MKRQKRNVFETIKIQVNLFKCKYNNNAVFPGVIDIYGPPLSFMPKA